MRSQKKGIAQISLRTALAIDHHTSVAGFTDIILLLRVGLGYQCICVVFFFFVEKTLFLPTEPTPVGDDQGPERCAHRRRADSGKGHERVLAALGRQGVANHPVDTDLTRETALPVPARGVLPGPRLPAVQLPVRLLRPVHVPRLRLRAGFPPVRLRHG